MAIDPETNPASAHRATPINRFDIGARIGAGGHAEFAANKRAAPTIGRLCFGTFLCHSADFRCAQALEAMPVCLPRLRRTVNRPWKGWCIDHAYTAESRCHPRPTPKAGRVIVVCGVGINAA